MLILKILVLVLYANIAEYAIHRWALHGWLWTRHIKHHSDDSTNVFFVRDWLGVTVALALIGFSWALWGAWHWLPLIVFLVYYFVGIEAAHWLIHENHWSGHHMAHHADLEDGNYNIWLPVGDWIFGTKI